MPTKTPAKKTSAGKANALQKPLQPSEELAAVVGSEPVPRGQVVSKIWDYIRSHKLQNPENRREILARIWWQPPAHHAEFFRCSIKKTRTDSRRY